MEKVGVVNQPKALVMAVVVSLLAVAAVAQDSTKTAEVERAMPAPLNSLPCPSGDWVGTFKIGARSDAPDFALQKALCMAHNKSGIKIYGWINPSVNGSTSRNSTIPVSYNIQPNSAQLSQAVLRFER